MQVGKCKQQSYADCDKSVRLLAIAVTYCLEAEDCVGKWSGKDFPSKRQKLADVGTQGGSRGQIAVQNAESS